MLAAGGAAVGIVAVEISTQVLNRYLERRNKLREHRIALELESSDS